MSTTTNRIIYLPDDEPILHELYASVLQTAEEIYILSAYLTEWDFNVSLNKSNQRFSFIFGRDFGLSRKKAIKSVLNWLPNNKKHGLLVAENINGFHPKCLIWSKNNQYYSLIGSSNLTVAAFTNNYEINIVNEITFEEFNNFKIWIESIKKQCIAVSDDWLEQYKESQLTAKNLHDYIDTSTENTEVIIAAAHNIQFNSELIKLRQQQLKNHDRIRSNLFLLIQQCANEEISNSGFYDELNKYWSWENENNGQGIGNRLQSRGWVRTGKKANFYQLCNSYLKITQASDEDRDNVVANEIDTLATGIKNPVRGAVLSELLCLEYPELYPVLNEPIVDFLKDNKINSARGSSEGSRYIDIALKMRAIAAQHKEISNLAELDILIQTQYR